jgi:two-component system LytT family response regulator
MIRVVIVDDERPPRERIRSLLAAHPGGGFEIVAEAVDGSTAVDRITTLRPDLLFLDVQLPGLDGLEILDALGDDVPPAVVFVTAYDQHAIQAFDHHAVDYVLKPIVPARFAKAVDRACARLGVTPNLEVARLLADRAAQPGRSRRFACRVGGKVRLVSADEVLWFEGAGNYVRRSGPRSGISKPASIGLGSSEFTDPPSSDSTQSAGSRPRGTANTESSSPMGPSSDRAGATGRRSGP